MSSVTIIDYGVGNLFSLGSSFGALGVTATVTSDPADLATAERIILPGVGAFGDAIAKLRDCGMADALLREAAAGKPIMGICLGMQLLFDKSFEYGEHEGLGLVKGEIRPIANVIPPNLKIPHIGWNALHLVGEHPLFKYIQQEDCVYFVHSFYGTDCH